MRTCGLLGKDRKKDLDLQHDAFLPTGLFGKHGNHSKVFSCFFFQTVLMSKFLASTPGLFLAFIVGVSSPVALLQVLVICLVGLCSVSFISLWTSPSLYGKGGQKPVNPANDSASGAAEPATGRFATHEFGDVARGMAANLCLLTFFCFLPATRRRKHVKKQVIQYSDSYFVLIGRKHFLSANWMVQTNFGSTYLSPVGAHT